MKNPVSTKPKKNLLIQGRELQEDAIYKLLFSAIVDSSAEDMLIRILQTRMLTVI